MIEEKIVESIGYINVLRALNKVFGAKIEHEGQNNVLEGKGRDFTIMIQIQGIDIRLSVFNTDDDLVEDYRDHYESCGGLFSIFIPSVDKNEIKKGYWNFTRWTDSLEGEDKDFFAPSYKNNIYGKDLDRITRSLQILKKYLM